MLDVNKACRFDYEMLGEDLPVLAQRYDVPLSILEQECSAQGWYRRVEPTGQLQTSDIQAFAEQLEKTTRSKLSIVSLMRQIDNQAVYAQLEQAFLTKALDIADSIEPGNDKSAQQLLALIQAIDKLQSRNPLILADQLSVALKDKEGQGSGQAVNVYIANQVQ